MENMKETIHDVIMSIKKKHLEENSIEINDEASLINDLGFTSLDLAQLIAELENYFEVDPFSEGALISDIQKVEDLYKIYQQSLTSKTV